MKTLLERRLAEFVDREEELSIFRNVLDSPDHHVLVISGGGGVGKSMLMAKLIHECSLRGLRKTEVIWSDLRSHDYLAIIRKVRDDLGAPQFNELTDLINYYTVPQYNLSISVSGGSVHVAEQAAISGSSVRDIAGIIVRDLMLVAPRSDLGVSEMERLGRLTDCFIRNLSSSLRENGPLVVFLDGAEKMSDLTRRWIWEELLASVLDGRLAGAKFVVCGRDRAPASVDRLLLSVVESAELQPLDVRHVVEYLRRRGVTDSSEPIALALVAATQGNPLAIATAVDAILEMKERDLAR
jgi:GTPase SAR1 family protein